MSFAGPQYPIPSAAERPLFDGAGLPEMRETVVGWMRPLILSRVIKQQVNFRIVESEEQLNTRGVIQPFSKRRLEMKPEGERSWEWIQIHTTPDLKMENGWIIKIANKQYRVVGQWDFSRYGYMEYELCNDYTTHR